jgi:soluble lytic murein transglycosylase
VLERTASVAEFLGRRATGLSPAQVQEVAHTVVVEADRAGFTPGLIVALIHVESSGRSFVRSHAGAVGLMQLLPATGRSVARRIGVPWDGTRTLYDPVANVRLGVAYLQELVKRFDGDLEAALAAYNWGPTRIADWRRRGRTIPTGYARRVLRYYQHRAFGLGLA